MREYPLKWGPADYLLFVDRQAVGVIEAKRQGVNLTGVELQAEKYSMVCRPATPDYPPVERL